ncbi:hypothetical protein [Tolypothrix sp. VBCCA 56010]|uniref:hypothetical protein n=1 Tax=Tolypothrix sp. VBCCA 56010 TaxID=3137731 RepID=UPI003D7D5BDE
MPHAQCPMTRLCFKSFDRTHWLNGHTAQVGKPFLCRCPPQCPMTAGARLPGNPDARRLKSAKPPTALALQRTASPMPYAQYPKKCDSRY